eukprot:CAMPEP_0181175060 /NCGR_PEP_ID=MMETSP1096-20121128/3873_1 /TAXON_ID=156174 ORGANISM="Chrysochromulina ericina, Strain CCMP281" /NCGR_SAMPLE_ID=MMETSP1096 /ASSEMBLY_ACC=CAM_ASM_000453 /LENGTH=122 /DNA_ID=CAMNT_0023263013 /DNA_START=224 /DNA_END=590 /DNA_ORIENTATION=+
MSHAMSHELAAVQHEHAWVRPEGSIPSWVDDTSAHAQSHAAAGGRAAVAKQRACMRSLETHHLHAPAPWHVLLDAEVAQLAGMGGVGGTGGTGAGGGTGAEVVLASASNVSQPTYHADVGPE